MPGVCAQRGLGLVQLLADGICSSPDKFGHRQGSELCTLGVMMGMELQSQGGDVQGTETTPNAPNPPVGLAGTGAARG